MCIETYVILSYPVPKTEHDTFYYMENCSSATIPEAVCNHGMFSALAKTHYKKKHRREDVKGKVMSSVH
jgi:hypothetical protein